MVYFPIVKPIRDDCAHLCGEITCTDVLAVASSIGICWAVCVTGNPLAKILKVFDCSNLHNVSVDAGISNLFRGRSQGIIPCKRACSVVGAMTVMMAKHGIDVRFIGHNRVAA